MAYYNVNSMWSKNRFFNMVFGGRGIGKTFGLKLKALREGALKKKATIYLRRYQTDLDMLDKNNFINETIIRNAFRNVEITNYEATDKKVIIEFTADEFDKPCLITIVSQKVYFNGRIIIYMKALSTFNKLKGSEYDDVYLVMFDEVLIDVSSTQRYLPREVEALLNLLYSVFRNRKGVKAVLLSNSTDYNNPYFAFFNFMGDNSKEFYYLADNSVLIQFPRNSALDNVGDELPDYFKILKLSDAYDSVVSNTFEVKDTTGIKKFKGYKNFIANFKVGNSFYRCFSTLSGYYFDIGQVDDQTFVLTYEDIERKNDRLLRENKNFMAKLKRAYLTGNMYFETAAVKYDINAFIKQLF